MCPCVLQHELEASSRRRGELAKPLLQKVCNARNGTSKYLASHSVTLGDLVVTLDLNVPSIAPFAWLQENPESWKKLFQYNYDILYKV